MNQEENEYLRQSFVEEKKDAVMIKVCDIDNRDFCFSDNYVFWLEKYVMDLREMLGSNVL